MKSADDQIKKTIGEYPEKSPLQRLKEINEALKKLGCTNKPEESESFYRKIIGGR
jgi:hypothetical protein